LSISSLVGGWVEIPTVRLDFSCDEFISDAVVTYAGAPIP
jgi:hypothetical protein